MPDRILRQGILSSDRVNVLTWPAEVFYRRLMSVADDYGRYDARVPILRANLYPLKLDRVSDSDVAKWLGEGSKAGLIRIYQVEGKDYLEIRDFNQRLRAMKSKYPTPDNIGGHPRADDSRVRPESEADTEANSDSETETKRNPKKGPDGQVLERVGRGKRKIFESPSLQEVAVYFLQNVGDPKKTNPWPVDRCRNTAGEFFNHYTANGWVQGKGKPIVDWQAAARKWMSNAIKGTFEKPVITQMQEKRPTPPSQVPDSPQRLDVRAEEINYLYGRFLENRCTIISLEALQYDYLKKTGKINFPDNEVEALKKITSEHFFGRQETPDERTFLITMKKFAILHYFTALQQENKTEVYESP